MSTVKEADAKAAYAALVDFAGVVKANPITASTPASSVSGGSIGAAAGKLSAAAYPFIKDVDWTSDLFLKPIPGADPQKVMKAVDKMIVMGSAMDGAALKEAAAAHVKAIDGVDAKGVRYNHSNTYLDHWAFTINNDIHNDTLRNHIE